MWICRPGFIYGLYMMALHHISYLQFGNLVRVSRTMDRTRRVNSIACSFPWFKSLGIFSMGHLKCSVYAALVSHAQDLLQ
jgi:hypothetical protein